MLPVIWLGGGTIAAIVAGVVLRNEPDFEPGTLVFVMLVQLTLSYLYIELFIFCLADEVWDCGDSLLIRNGGTEARVRMSDVSHVEYNTFFKPPRIAIVSPDLPEPIRQIVFMPPSRLHMRRAVHPVAEDLLRRAKDANNAP